MRFLITPCVTALMLLNAAAGLPAVSAQQETPPVAIGLLVAASGDVASMGEECRRGFLAAASVYPGNKVGAHEVRYVWGDHRGEARSAVSEFQRLADMEHVAAVATHHSQPSMQLNPLSQRKQIPLLSVAGHVAFLEGNPYAFRFWYSTRGESRLLGAFVAARHKQRFAIVSVQDEYALSFRHELMQTLKEAGVRKVEEFEVAPAEREFQTIVARLKSAKPEALVVNVAIPQAQALMTQVRSLAFAPDIILGNGWFGLSELETQAKSGIFDGLVFAKLSPPDLTLGSGTFSVSSTPISYTCYTELSALLQAIERCSEPVTRDSVYRGLLQLSTIAVPPTPLKLIEREALYPLQLVTYVTGKQTTLGDIAGGAK